MEKTKKKSKGLIVLLIVILIVLLFAAAFIVVQRNYAMINGSPVSTDETYIDLRGSESLDMEALAKLENPETIDIRESALGIDDYEILKAAIPASEILWEVPFAGERYAPETDSFVLSALSAEDKNTLKYFTSLKELDLREADMSAEDIAALKSEYPDCHILWTVKVCEGLAPRKRSHCRCPCRQRPAAEPCCRCSRSRLYQRDKGGLSQHRKERL